MELSGLSGQVAVVTGASSGLGRATALELARLGAILVVNHPPRMGSREKAAAAKLKPRAVKQSRSKPMSREKIRSRQ